MTHRLITSLLILCLGVLVSCNRTDNSPIAQAPPVPQAQPVQTSPTTTAAKIKLKSDDGKAVFEFKPQSNGAKVVDGSERELVRLTTDPDQKVKLKNAADKELGYIVRGDNAWKVKSADQSKDLYILRRQADGDYKLEDGADKPIYRIKVREGGYEIETPEKRSLYKVKVKDGKISLKDSNGQTVLATKAAMTPVAIACFGFKVLSPEQQAALAYAVNQSGGR